jgi:hypothetical protein
VGTTQRSGQGEELSVEQFGVRPGAEINNCGRLHPEHCGGERSGDGGVAHLYLAEGDNNVPPPASISSREGEQVSTPLLYANTQQTAPVTRGI